MENNEKLNPIIEDDYVIKEVPEKSLEEIIREVAEEEGLSYEETKRLFMKGMKDALGYTNKNKKDKKKAKAKRKQAKKSRKKNRKR